MLNLFRQFCPWFFKSVCVRPIGLGCVPGNPGYNLRSSSDVAKNFSKVLREGPDLAFFIQKFASDLEPPTKSVEQSPEYISPKKVFLEVHGCQMNNSDAEVVWSVLRSAGYQRVHQPERASAVLILTCAIRDSAEEKIWNRLEQYKRIRKRSKKQGFAGMKIGILGCMAERLKEKIIDREKLVDLVAGPDSYRDLPRLLDEVSSGQAAVNVILSKEETYADILPVQLTDSACTAFVSIQRGCDNFCSFCIVPFVRGKERSRPISSLVYEVQHLVDKGVREITLLGQNVNSYRDLSEPTVGLFSSDAVSSSPSRGFRTIYKPKIGGQRFVHLLERISNIDPELRIRFQSAHPKDFPDELLQLINESPNICKQIHLPAQSGSSDVLKAMRRGYTRESYLELVQLIRSFIPDVAFTSDFIAGFCGETEEDHDSTIRLMKDVKYGFVYAFPYSMRENTSAHKRLSDDVPLDVKQRRTSEILSTFREIALDVNRSRIGTTQLVLIAGASKRSSDFLSGRADCGTKVIFPKRTTSSESLLTTDPSRSSVFQPGSYVEVQITDASSQVLHGTPLGSSSIKEFFSKSNTSAGFLKANC